MRSFIAFYKKELLEGVRSSRLTVLAVIFALLGVMNPAIAKLTPWMLELFSEQLADSGIILNGVTVDALTSWTQFFKNIPMGLIAFVLLFGASFTKEYESETLVLIVTKGFSRAKIVMAKTAYLLSLWTFGYWLCFAITYLYNAYFWDNAIAKGLFPSVLFYFVFGIFVIFLLVFISVLVRSYGVLLLSLGISLLAVYLLSLIPKLSRFTPFALTDSAALLVGAEAAGEFIVSLCISLLISAVCFGLAIPLFNKKQL